MEKQIKDLPKRQRKIVSNLVQNNGQDLSSDSFLIDMPLAKTPDGSKILTVTHAEGLSSIKMVEDSRTNKSLAIMDERRMKMLVR